MSKGPFRSMSQRSWSRILIIHRSNLHFFSLLVEQNEQLKLHASIESSFFFLEEAAFSNRVQRHRTNMMIKLSVSYVTQKCKCPFSFRRTPIWDILWFVTFFFGGWFAWHLIAALGQLQQCDYVFAFGRENDIYVVLHRLLGLLPVHVVFIGLLLALLPMARWLYICCGRHLTRVRKRIFYGTIL